MERGKWGDLVGKGREGEGGSAGDGETSPAAPIGGNRQAGSTGPQKQSSSCQGCLYHGRNGSLHPPDLTQDKGRLGYWEEATVWERGKGGHSHASNLSLSSELASGDPELSKKQLTKGMSRMCRSPANWHPVIPNSASSKNSKARIFIRNSRI